MKQDWFWAAHDEGIAGERFVIAQGQEELWRRVCLEVADDEACAWNAVHPGREEPRLDDVLDLFMTVLPAYCVSWNKFVLELAQIPVFADFLRDSRRKGLSDYVANSVAVEDAAIPVGRYDRVVVRALARLVGRIED